MKIACLQMDVKFGCVEENFLHAENLIASAMKDAPDVIILPETWNTGFFPKERLFDLCDRDGARVSRRIGALARQYRVNIIAGSVSNVRNGQIYNTACVFDWEGNCIAQYDKVHLFSPMGEDTCYTPGDHLCHFSLDGVNCGLLICYDLRFPHLSSALEADILFVPSQWPAVRISQLRTLCAARAIENQAFLVNCNGCGIAGQTRFGGHSAVYNPTGEILQAAADTEAIFTVNCDLHEVAAIRKAIPLAKDRRIHIR